MTTANVVTNNVVKTKVFSTKMDKISSFFYKKSDQQARQAVVFLILPLEITWKWTAQPAAVGGDKFL